MAQAILTAPAVQSTVDLVREAVICQAERRPGATALKAGTEELTYGQLHAHSDNLAAILKFIGVGPDLCVGVCLPRSPGMAIAALAVWKAGGAYVPMDPGYPADRLAFIARDSRTCAVIASGPLESIPGSSERRIVDIGESETPREFKAEPEPADPDRLAYVIYTSGSTGRPKGVEIAHRGLANLVAWHNEEFSVTGADRASHLAGLGFDAAVWELWPYLAAGASVHLVDDLTRSSAALLRAWLLENRITVSFVPTPLAEQLLPLDWPAQSDLRILLTGGDRLNRLPRPGLPFALINNYGPTECTVVATSGPVSPGACAEGAPAIGRPIANTEVYLLDDARRPVRPGEEGEIYIGGAGVARGYRNHPALTAARFVEDPFSGQRGSRLFRTGDRARLRGDGQLLFLGRVDDQIKIRGYRIEPGEVTAALNRHPNVRQSYVTARENTDGNTFLVAYLVIASGANPAAMELRNFLRDLVPEFMVPQLFVRLEALATTEHGKVDRAALPAPDSSNTIPESAPVRALTGTEARVAAIVSRLLGIGTVGPDENFFLMGGHSLLGAQLIIRLREAFGVEVPLRRLFEAPSVAGLSAEIELLRQQAI